MHKVHCHRCQSDSREGKSDDREGFSSNSRSCGLPFRSMVIHTRLDRTLHRPGSARKRGADQTLHLSRQLYKWVFQTSVILSLREIVSIGIRCPTLIEMCCGTVITMSADFVRGASSNRPPSCRRAVLVLWASSCKSNSSLSDACNALIVLRFVS
jgi:hypothetical protein